jgi:hypothetical protein
MNEVFISYSRRDEPFVRKLDAALKKEGRDSWVDWDDIPLSADWWAEIQEGIEAADSFVFVISPDSAESEVCGKEVAYALKHNKRIVPIVYRDVPAKELPPGLPQLNWAFFRDSDDFDEAFNKLMEAMDTDLGWVKAHTRLTRRAVEWKKKEKNESFLLRGDDLEEAMRHLRQSERQPQLTALQQEYIAASSEKQDADQARALEEARRLAEESEKRRLAEQERAEVEKQRAEEQAEANKKLRKRALYLTVALASSLVLFCGAIIFFFNLSQAWTGATKITEYFVETGDAQVNAQMCRVGAIHDLADEVFEACNRAIELDPDNSLYYENRALAFMFGTDVESPEKAIEDLSKAIDLAQEQDQFQDKIDDWQSWIEVLEEDEIPDIQEELKEAFDTGTE